jgi:predicted outer membrane lipoprotein
MEGTFSTSGSLAVKKIKATRAPLVWRLSNVLRWAYIKGWFAVFIGVPIARAFGLMTAYGKLEAMLIRADGTKINYGVLGYRVVTTAFVNFVTDQLQTESSLFGDFKFHDGGVGTTAENAADTAMETTDGESRATGTQTESAANAYRSVGTISYTSTKAVTEHGLFNDATTGTLMDRTVFSAVNVVNGDSIAFTYTLTLSSGG